MIIGIVGSIASGKSVLAEALVEKGFISFNISNEVREEARNLGIQIERKALQDLGNGMREKYGNGYWAERLIKKMEAGKNYVIAGIRNQGEIDSLKKLGNFILIGIDAPIEKRFQWIIARNKDSDPKTIEEIRAIDSRDKGAGEPLHGQQSQKCYEMADVFIMNEGTFEELTKKVNDLLEEIKC